MTVMHSFRLHFEKSPDARLTDDHPAGTYRYEGPFGPMESYREKRTATGNPTTTTLTGPKLGEATIAWGKGALERPPPDGVEKEERLRRGVPLRIRAGELLLRQPSRGFTRSARAFVIEADGRPHRRMRLRRAETLSLEAPDGSVLGLSAPWAWGKGKVAEEADLIDVATLLLVEISELRDQLKLTP